MGTALSASTKVCNLRHNISLINHVLVQNLFQKSCAKVANVMSGIAEEVKGPFDDTETLLSLILVVQIQNLILSVLSGSKQQVRLNNIAMFFFLKTGRYK